jgi:transcriptional regulator with XRE-family HTH domain
MVDISNFAMFMNKNQIHVAFGDTVRKLRKEKGLSQEDLSYRANLHRTYIGMIERAEKNITLTNIEKIAKALDVDIKKLF